MALRCEAVGAMSAFQPAQARIAVGLGVLAILCLSLFSACDPDAGRADEPVSGTVPGAAGQPASAVGPGLSIGEALESTLDQPLLVNGFIVVRDGVTRLCSNLRESFPPQCGGDSLTVEGLDLKSLEGLDSAQGVTWSNEFRQVLGTVSNGVLTVSARLSA